jgi:uncharacterized membrane protein YfbV (UPF0208 family)
MDNRGAVAGKVLIAIAVVIVGALLVFIGQIGMAVVAVVIALIILVAALWSRARTPTDIR